MVRVVWVQEKKANCPHLEMDLNLTRYLTLPLAANKKRNFISFTVNVTLHYQKGFECKCFTG